MSDDSLEQRLRRIFAANNNNVPPRPEPTYNYRVELRYDEPDAEGAPECELSITISVCIDPMTQDAFDACSDEELIALAIAALPAKYQTLAVTWPLESVEIRDFDRLDQTNEDAIEAWDDQYGEFADLDEDYDDDDAPVDQSHEYDLGGW